MKQYGIIGYPLSHSFSPAYFNDKFAAEKIDAEYLSLPVKIITQVAGLQERYPDLMGLNVTIPHKTTIIPYLDFISTAAREINAVNCIKITDGKLHGFNTDYFGFGESLKSLLNNTLPTALVLGTGGSSKAICYALSQMGIEYKLVSATGKGDYAYAELNEKTVQENLLIINTTPLGMFPSIDACPDIPYHFLTENHLLYDLIYNPEETLFLQKGKAQHATIKSGYEMLLLQAEKSWQIWNDPNTIGEIIMPK